MSLKSRLKRIARAVLSGDAPSGGNLPVFNESIMRRAIYFGRLLASIRDIDGAIVECGVGQGRGLAMWTSLSLLEPRERQIWAFDSFEGFPKLSDKDQASPEFEADLAEYKKFTVLYVLNTLQQFGISRSDIDRRIAFAKGFIPESLSFYDEKPVALLHLDLDIYEPYKTALEFFWERLAPGGIVAFDEYNKALDVHKWPGAQCAINEFLDARNLRGSIQRDSDYGNVFIRKDR